jgi:hypothetical protein
MLFNKTKELPKYEDKENAQITEEMNSIQGSVIMIVQNLLENISFYTEKIEELEKENTQLKEFIGELAEVVSGDREYLLVQMEAYLSSKNLMEEYENR